MKEYSDNEIIECLRSRQSYVVRYLSDRYMPMIRLMVYRMGGNVEDARDIFQEGLEIILRKIDDHNFVLGCKLKTLFYAICENLWKSVLEKRQAAANYLSNKTSSDYENDFTELLDNELYEKVLRDVFESMDEVSKKILTLYWEEKPPGVIADILGYTYGYVRKKKCEAQAELIDKVKNHPVYKSIMRTDSMVMEKVY